MSTTMHAAILADQGQIQATAARLEAPIAGAAALPSEAGAHGQAGGFADSFKQALHSVDQQDRAASDKMADVDSGRSDDLVGAMLASQDANLSFSMLMQVRNKVMGAMDELIKLPL